MPSKISAEKLKSKPRIIGFCRSALVIIRGANAFLFSALSVMFSDSALGFFLRNFSSDFSKLDSQFQLEIIENAQRTLVPIAIAALGGLFLMQILFELYIKHAEFAVSEVLNQLKKQNKILNNRISKYNYFSQGIGAFVKMYFSVCAKKCGLTDQERLSFYVREKKGGKKLAISDRNSSNPDYQSIIRETYNTNQGIIHLAKRKGSALIGNLPDYESQANEYYAKCSSSFSMPKSAVEALSMKARFYYAFRFSSHDNQDYNSMVVLESMNPTFSTKEKLDAIFSLDNEFVYCLVDTFKDQMPKLKISKKGKF